MSVKKEVTLLEDLNVKDVVDIAAIMDELEEIEEELRDFEDNKLQALYDLEGAIKTLNVAVNHVSSDMGEFLNTMFDKYHNIKNELKRRK